MNFTESALCRWDSEALTSKLIAIADGVTPTWVGTYDWLGRGGISNSRQESWNETIHQFASRRKIFQPYQTASWVALGVASNGEKVLFSSKQFESDPHNQ